MMKLPLTVSSKLTNLDATDVAVQLTAYANETQTAEKAPVLLAVQSATHVDADTFASLLVQEGGQGTAAQARLAVNAIASALGKLVDKYGAITVQTPFGMVQTFVAGTVDEAHDQPDPETNYPFLAVVVPEPYRKLFAKYETYIPAEACPVTLKRVRDKATNRSSIFGTQPFYLEGNGMTFGGVGEKLELLDATTKELVTAVTVDEPTPSKVQFLCSLAGGAAVPVGDYLLRLTTLAGSETTLWPVDLKVEVVEAIPAPPEPIYTSDLGGIRVFAAKDSQGDALPDDELNVPDTDAQLVLEGEGLVLTDPDNPTTGIGKAYFKASDSAETCESSLTPLEDGKLALSLGMDSAALEDGSYPDAKYIFFAYKDGESDSLEIPFRLLKRA